MLWRHSPRTVQLTRLQGCDTSPDRYVLREIGSAFLFLLLISSFELEYIGELQSCGCFLSVFPLLLQIASLLLIHVGFFCFCFSQIGYYRVWSKCPPVIQWAWSFIL